MVPIQIKRYILFLKFYSDIVPIEDTLNVVTDNLLHDKKDIPILATFIAGSADWLVSGDHHLHAVQDQYPVITAREFLSML